MSPRDQDKEIATYRLPNAAEFSKNMIKAAAKGQRLLGDFIKRRGDLGLPTGTLDPLQVGRTFLEVLGHYARDPQRAAEAQVALWQDHLNLWQSAAMRVLGEEVSPTALPERGDKRFHDSDWNDMFVFDFIKQSYLLTGRWLQQQVVEMDELDQQTRKKADFYMRQFIDALSPTNFILTNPEVLRETLSTDGENLVKGLGNLIEDFERGDGQLSIRQTDMDAFSLGENIALTPGKVVYQNDLMQLIQYEPSTKKVYRRPLVFFPPWINKYYILDLNPRKSMVQWLVSKGYTVFVVSWVNPNKKLAMKSFEDYMTEGVYGALDAIQKATGEKSVNAVGYCIGGTLLGATLAHMAAKDDKRINSATFFAAQVDFTEAGELSVFIDEEQLAGIEGIMEAEGGYLPGRSMAQTFNMLRSNDLIWSYVINNYLLGRDPFPFDLLYWNADATRMPAKMHLFYLRECYLKNNLSTGRMQLGGERLDLADVKIPIYLQSSKEDHIAPYNSVYKATHLYSGPVRFIVAGSGHIAGVINPPAMNKYQYWTNDETAETARDWLAGATEHPGSWWPDWESWLRKKSGKKVEAREPGEGKLKAIEAAPGSYVAVPGH